MISYCVLVWTIGSHCEFCTQYVSVSWASVKCLLIIKKTLQPLIGYLLGFCPWDVANVIVQYQMQAACQVAKFMPTALIVVTLWPQTNKSGSFG